jgi:hypothetical protein
MNRRGIGGTGLSPLEPSQLAGLTLWLRAGNGGSASAWNDLSGAGANFTQASGPIQPVFSASDANFNGQASLTFSPVDSCMTSASSIAVKHIFIVANYPAAVFSALATTMTKGAAAGDFILRGAGGSLPDWRTSDDAPGTRLRDAVVTDTALDVANRAHLYERVLTSLTTASTWTIGRDPGTSGRQWSGGIAEIIAYNVALSGTDLARIRLGLKKRYGTP